MEGEDAGRFRGLVVTIAVRLIHPWSDIRNSRCRKTPRLETPDLKLSGALEHFPELILRAPAGDRHARRWMRTPTAFSWIRRKQWASRGRRSTFDQRNEVAVRWAGLVSTRGSAHTRALATAPRNTTTDKSQPERKQSRLGNEVRDFSTRPLGRSAVDAPCLGGRMSDLAHLELASALSPTQQRASGNRNSARDYLPAGRANVRMTFDAEHAGRSGSADIPHQMRARRPGGLEAA